MLSEFFAEASLSAEVVIHLADFVFPFEIDILHFFTKRLHSLVAPDLVTVISSVVRLLYWLLRYRWYNRILGDVDFGSFEAPRCVYILKVLRPEYFFRHVGLVLGGLT